MQTVLQWDEGIALYKSSFKQIKLQHPERCHECGCTKFHKWGKYERFVIEKDADHYVPIQRIRCVKCRKTYSYLPSFCISRSYYSVELIMNFLETLILRVRREIKEMRRQAYRFKKLFIRLENTWITYLRIRGIRDFPAKGNERTVKIFTALLKIYESENLLAGFLRETGRHFMREK